MNNKGQSRISTPSGLGGIVRYFDEYKSKIVIKPGHVVFWSIAIILAAILLQIFGKFIFGF